MRFLSVSYLSLILFTILTLTFFTCLDSAQTRMVSNEADLEAAIRAAEDGDTIKFQEGFQAPYTKPFQSLNADDLLLPRDIGFTIDGSSKKLTATSPGRGSVKPPGFFVRGNSSGKSKLITIKNLEIEAAYAKGGDGGQAVANGIGGNGGGGLGAGGGLFLNTNAHVVLENVTFTNCSAVGGGGHATAMGNSKGGSGGGGGGLRGGKGGRAFGGATGLCAGAGAGFDSAAVKTLHTEGAWCGESGFAGHLGKGKEGIGRLGGEGSNGGNGGFGGGGGAGSVGWAVRGSGGHGGFGGGGGGAGGSFVDRARVLTGGNGGDGGFGGGGGGASSGTRKLTFKRGNRGGDGGFGGGGGGFGGNFEEAGKPDQSTSEFGGGAGADPTGNNQKSGGSGGGAALGGSIFLQEGSTLTVRGELIFVGSSTTAGGGANPGQALGKEVFMMSGSTLIFDSSEDITIPSPIESNEKVGGDDKYKGLGGLIKRNSGVVTLKGVNRYTGKTIIEGGTLSLVGVGAGKEVSLEADTTEISKGGTLEVKGNGNLKKLEGSGSITIDTGKGLTCDEGEFSGIISGEGNLILGGAGKSVTLSGENSFTGTLQTRGGTLTFSSSESLGKNPESGITIEGVDQKLFPLNSMTIEKGITINATGKTTIHTPQGTALILIKSATKANNQGSFNKEGAGELFLKESSPIAGEINLKEGTLKIDKGKTLGSNSTVNVGDGTPSSRPTLAGSGTLAASVEVKSGGSVRPGLSVGTLKVEGNYKQEGGSILKIEVDPEGSSKLEVKGDVTIEDGSRLEFIPHPGLYEKDQDFEFLSGGFASPKEQENFKVSFASNALPVDALSREQNRLNLKLPGAQVIIPVSYNQLTKNGKVITDYLRDDLDKLSGDFKNLFGALLADGTRDKNYVRNILKLGPQQFGALALSGLQSSTRTSRQMNRADLIYQRKSSMINPRQNGGKEDAQVKSSPEKTVWINPIGFYYKQNEDTPEQFPFDVRSYGFTLGFQGVLPNKLALGGGVGYTYSDLKWSQSQGTATIQSVYIAPSFSYIGEVGYGSIMLSCGPSFYDVKRKIEFADIKREAQSYHTGFDLIIGMSGGLSLKMPGIFGEGLFCIPTLNLDFVNLFEGGYEESGAGSANLFIEKKLSSFFRPELTLKISQQLSFGKLSVLPTLYFGWVKSIALNQDQEKCKAKIMSKEMENAAPMIVESYRPPGDQLVIGAELTAFYQEHLCFKFGYEANLVGSTYAQGVTLGFDWKF